MNVRPGIMKQTSIMDEMRRPIKLGFIHVITAAIFLFSIIALAIASEAFVGGFGPIQSSWIALGASFVPVCWSVVLMCNSRYPRTLGWSSFILSIVVVAIGSKFTWPAINTLL